MKHEYKSTLKGACSLMCQDVPCFCFCCWGVRRRFLQHKKNPVLGNHCHARTHVHALVFLKHRCRRLLIVVVASCSSNETGTWKCNWGTFCPETSRTRPVAISATSPVTSPVTCPATLHGCCLGCPCNCRCNCRCSSHAPPLPVRGSPPIPTKNSSERRRRRRNRQRWTTGWCVPTSAPRRLRCRHSSRACW